MNNPPEKHLDDLAWVIVRDVAELPDRSSPEDWPEALLVTSQELHDIIMSHFEEAHPSISPSGDIVERVRKVLEPFAAEMDMYDDVDDGRSDTDWLACIPTEFKIGDLRAARDLLAAIEAIQVSPRPDCLMVCANQLPHDCPEGIERGDHLGTDVSVLVGEGKS